MGKVLHRRDFAVDAKGLGGIEVQLKSYNIVRCGAILPRRSSCPIHSSLAATGDLVFKLVSPGQRLFNFGRLKTLEGHGQYPKFIRQEGASRVENLSK